MGYGGDLVLNTPWLSCRDPGIIILRTRATRMQNASPT